MVKYRIDYDTEKGEEIRTLLFRGHEFREVWDKDRAVKGEWIENSIKEVFPETPIEIYGEIVNLFTDCNTFERLRKLEEYEKQFEVKEEKC